MQRSAEIEIIVQRELKFLFKIAVGLTAQQDRLQTDDVVTLPFAVINTITAAVERNQVFHFAFDFADIGKRFHHGQSHGIFKNGMFIAAGFVSHKESQISGGGNRTIKTQFIGIGSDIVQHAGFAGDHIEQFDIFAGTRQGNCNRGRGTVAVVDQIVETALFAVQLQITPCTGDHGSTDTALGDFDSLRITLCGCRSSSGFGVKCRQRIKPAAGLAVGDFSVNGQQAVFRLIADNKDTTAVGVEFTQQFQHTFREVADLRNDDRIVRTFTDHDLIAVNAAHITDDLLVGKVVGQLPCMKFSNHSRIGLRIGVDLFAVPFAVRKKFPRRRNRMHDQNIRPALSFGKKHTGTGNAVVENAEIFPPGLMISLSCGIVAFPQTAERVPRKVVAEIIDTGRHLRQIDPAHTCEMTCPAGHGKVFGHNLFLTELTGGGNKLDRSNL